MEHKVCNKDCFNCPYPDCINDMFDAEDYEALEQSESAVQKQVAKAQSSAYRKRYCEMHKEEIAKQHHDWYLRNKEKVKATHAEYRRNNREKVRSAAAALVKKRREQDPEKYRAQQRAQGQAYYQKNRESIRARARERYRLAHCPKPEQSYWQFAHSSQYGDGFVCFICGCWMFANAHKPDVCPTCSAQMLEAPPEQGRLRSVEELTVPELDELRELYSMLRKEEFAAVSDATLFKRYGTTLFHDDDFACNMKGAGSSGAEI